MTDRHEDRLPARHLLTATLKGAARNALTHDGPMGRRVTTRPDGGDFEGERLRGTVPFGLSGEWQLESRLLPGVAHVEGVITLQAAEGAVILLRYVGRRAPRYGADSWRVGVAFEADREGFDWLNDLHGIGFVERIGDDVRFTVSELLGRSAPRDAAAIAVEPVYGMQARGSVGDRHTILGQSADRYFTLSENGGRLYGGIEGAWAEAYSWNPHRMGRGAHGLPFQIDRRASLVAADGTLITQHYIGVTPRSVLDPAPDADRSWRSTAVFEAPVEGPHAWLNAIVAVGHGWVEDNEATYDYRAVR